jgi:hypothetical protein
VYRVSDLAVNRAALGLEAKDRPEAVSSWEGIALSWQGNSFSSARARERGSAPTVSIVESGAYLQARGEAVFCASVEEAITSNYRWSEIKI